MPAQAGAGVKAHKAKGLGGGGVDDLPDINAHLGEDDFHLVHQGDVDAAKNIFEEFGGIGHVALLRWPNMRGYQ